MGSLKPDQTESSAQRPGAVGRRGRHVRAEAARVGPIATATLIRAPSAILTGITEIAI